LKGKSQTSSQAIQTATATAEAQAQAQALNQQESPWQGLNNPPTTQPSLGLDSSNSAEAAAAAAANAPKKQGAFMCGFCKEEDMVKTCTRKNDLKRHIEDFHNVNAQWHCRHRGCKMVFDWQAAYKAHLKTSHGGSRMSLDEAKVNLCPQVVFACGFENCLQVFEAAGDNDASATFKEYVAHVVKHFDEGSNSGEWTYSARIRNLLRQSAVNSTWTEAVWNEAARNQLQWQSQTSGILRKRLETRHIGNVKVLVQYAFLLGSDPSRITKYTDDFITPIVDTCTMNIPGHKIRQPQRAPPPEPDPFQFRISRGANPALAAYIASQRRVYVPRPGHRPSRPHQLQSPRPTMTAPTSNPMNPTPYFTSLPEPAPASPLFDPSVTRAFSPTASMMPQGGIIADDLQSLRSMANGTPEPDMEMTDTPMLSADFSSPYASGMHTPPDALGSPASMHHHDPFNFHNEPHAF
jgi:hypothetical protein